MWGNEEDGGDVWAMLSDSQADAPADAPATTPFPEEDDMWAAINNPTETRNSAGEAK